MPIPQIFYLNAPSLGSSTAVFYDAALTVCAADGYYSDGLITREQVGCTLLPQQDCPFCGTSCSPLGTITTGTDDFIYQINVDTGAAPTDIGAIIIEFYPNDVPNGIIANFTVDAFTIYNQLSSEFYGLLGAGGSTLYDYTYVGNETNKCSFIGSSSALNLDVYEYNGSTFISTGDSLIIYSETRTDRTTKSNPGKCIMVVPKISNLYDTLTIKISSPCYPDDGSTIIVNCPALLRSFTGSTREADPATRCALPTNVTYYVAPVNGSNPYLGLYDWVFIDPYGAYKLADGFYKTNFLTLPDDTIEVQNGVIISISQTC